MSAVSPRLARTALVWPALLATVLLLILLLGGYTLIESRRMQQNLGRELQERAVALIGILEASSRNAIESETSLEDVLAQRLLDNARFVDFLVARTPQSKELIDRLASLNRLAKVELLDPQGGPARLPAPELPAMPPWAGGRRPGGLGWRGPGGSPDAPAEDPGASARPPAMRGMMRPPEGGRGTPFLGGQRWSGLRGDPDQLFPSLPKNAKIRSSLKEGLFTLEMPATSFSGLIRIQADAAYLERLRRATGLQRLIEDLGRQPGVAEVTLLDKSLTALASSDAALVGRQEADTGLAQLLETGGVRARRETRPDGREVFSVVCPFTLESQRVGLIRLALGTEGFANVSQRAQQGILWYSLGLLAVGVLGAAAIFWVQARHLTERRALEGAIVREQRLSAMGNLAAGVAHEVRNPLNAISIGLQRLRREFPPVAPSPREEYGRLTRIIEAEVTRLNTILERFLTLARPLKLSLAVEPLEPVLAEVLSLLGPQAEAQRIRIDHAVRLDGSRIAMDRSQLLHAFLNVVLNAIQAMPRGGTIRVRATAEDSAAAGPGVRIVIADTGPGIPADHLDRIFEPYFTTKDGGTGLGLALTHKIVLEHGGTIRAGNQPEGGASFEIVLPLAPEGA